jgi:CRP-like cAMP-binding protein
MTLSTSSVRPGARRLAANRNNILASLPPAEYAALLPELEWVQVPNGLSLDEVDGAVPHAYFPTEGILSLCCTTETGECSELAVVGSDGMDSVCSFMEGGSPRIRALVRMPFAGYRLPAHRLKAKFRENEALQRQLLAYTESLIFNISLTALCNRYHTLDQQLCRWLLQTLDRVAADQLSVTQELIASLLGVRRQGVTEAVRELGKRGILTSTRGRITVTNPAGLRAHACDCYHASRAMR